MKNFRKLPNLPAPPRGSPSRRGIYWYLTQQRRKRAESGGGGSENELTTEDEIVLITEDGQTLTIE